MPVERERDLPLQVTFPPVLFVEGGVAFKNGLTTLATGKQFTASEGHRFDRSVGHYNEGGPFYTSRIDYHCTTVDVSEAFTSSGSDKIYSGPVYAPFPSDSELGQLAMTKEDIVFGDSNESQMNSDGATAISLASPVNSASELGTALGETYKDGLPSLPGIRSWRSRTLDAKNAGDEYLNQVFGWNPLVSDVKSVGSAARRSRDIALQYQRNEGKNSHRRFEYPLDTESWLDTNTGSSAVFPGWTSSWVNTEGEFPKRTLSRVKTSKRWFEGLFTYALPTLDDSWVKHIGFGEQADRLFGTNLDPTLLWELAPWSWAVDWFSNAGDVINNVTNFGSAGQVMRYGYTMEETIDEISVTQDFVNLRAPNEPFGRNKHLGPLVSKIVITTKRRAQANPFGFGIGWEDLSPTQLAISAALGISRVL